MFQSIQSVIHFGLVMVLMYIGLFIFQKERTTIDLKYLIITSLYIEIADIVIVFYSIFIILGGVQIASSYLFYILFELMILYLRYNKEESFNEIKSFLLYLISCIPAFFLSIYFADGIFALLGIQDAFMFHYGL
ncbi:MAG: hypothetical protein ACTSR8_03185 [Promethearchaeota archaeon]